MTTAGTTIGLGLALEVIVSGARYRLGPEPERSTKITRRNAISSARFRATAPDSESPSLATEV